MTNDQDPPKERHHANKVFDPICKMRVAILFKKSGKNGYRRSKDLTGYAYLGLDRGMNINFYIIVKSLFGIYQIRISQWNLFRMLLYRITLRPIVRQKNSFYPTKQIRRLDYDDTFFDLPIEDIKKELDAAFENIDTQIKIADGDDKILAEAQRDKLIRLQGKSELWSQIQKCKNHKIEVKEEELFG